MTVPAFRSPAVLLGLVALAASACSTSETPSRGGGGSPGAGSGGRSGSASAGSSGEGGTSGSDQPGDWLRDRHPGDGGLRDDPSVLFFDDFEEGWGRWDAPTRDTEHLFIEQGDTAHGGQRYLRSTVTEEQLAVTQYISASPRVAFEERVDTIYVRFHVRFPVVAPNPHHWVRFAAGTEDFVSSGRANTVPDGDEGFWFDFDANVDDLFNFYVYWHGMRSGRCNDGTTTPGCPGDQGTTYHYGNVFRPQDQQAFHRDRWFCVELEAHANQVGPSGAASDGLLAFYVDDALVGAYGPGYPEGTWLRDSFHEGGCDFSACTEPAPFEGFDFRTSADVRFKEMFLDAYYERDTTANRRATMEERGLTVSGEQTILYDDVVVATERIGCRLP